MAKELDNIGKTRKEAKKNAKNRVWWRADGGRLMPDEVQRGLSQVKCHDKIGVFNDTIKTIWVKTVSRLLLIKNFAIN